MLYGLCCMTLVVISKKEVEHIAFLARIELTEKEKEELSKDLSSILDFVKKLDEVDTSAVEPTAHVTGLLNTLRKDNNPKVLSGEELKKLVDQVPKRKNDYVKVRAVLK